MMKKICSLLMCLCLLMALPLSVMAAQDANMIQSVKIDGKDITIICADGTDSAGTYQVCVDGQEIPVTESNVRNEKYPVTVFCLVDTSGSISEYKMRLIQETLTELSDSMGEEDNMVIATLGNSLTVGPVLQTKEEREEAIGSIQTTHDDTNLYASIVQSLDKLISDTSYNPYGCVVVLSDGSDQQDNGMTEQEVMNAVKDAKRPLYTVALIEKGEEREGGKVLGSFARSSHGGIHQTTVSEGANKPIRWDMTGDEFGSTIWTSLQGMTVLWGDLRDVQIDSSKTEVRLDVTYVSGSDSYTDFALLNANELPAEPQELPPVTIAPGAEEETAEPETTVTETTGEVEQPIYKRPVFWAVIAVVVILAGVVILIVIKKGAKKQDAPLADGPVPVISDLDPTQGFDGGTAPIGSTTWGQTKDPAPTSLGKRYKVYMTDIPYGTQKLSYTVMEKEIVSFGRDKNRVTCVVNTKDTQLSGKHFSLLLQDSGYCIQDEGSTNGTYLNGVSISGKGWVKMNSEDKVRAGAYEYRVIIKEA